MRIGVLGLALALAVSACSTTMTGRRQLTLINEDKMDAMGIAAFSSLKAEGKLSQDPGVNEYVICVARAMLEVAVTPGQLAAVLGHEVSHVLLRRGNERMSQSILADATVNAASVAAGEAPKQWQSTRPADTTRIERLHENLPAAMHAYEMARAAGKDPTCEPPPDEWIAPEALP